MIIVRVMGGLGNQLFQYAFGKSISKRTDTTVAYDLSWFDTGAAYDHDILFLDYFKTEYDTASSTDVDAVFPFGRRSRRFTNHFYSKSPLAMQKLFNYYKDIKLDKQSALTTGPYRYTYSPAVYEAGDSVYFDGYWQAAQYVDSAAETLRDELIVRTEPTGQNAAYLSEIDSSNAVSIHFRRGDYTASNWALSKAYYRNAIERIEARVDDPQFFIFSDDIDCVKDEIEFDGDTTYIDHNDIETCYEDLRLMAACDHNIIANSTFSWWGAWMNQTESKTVLAPDVWLDNRVESIDILPADWATVPST